MWLPSAKLRTALEILVTLAVLAYVTYDLVGRGGKASEGLAGLPMKQSSSAIPASSTAQPALSSSRAQPQQVPSTITGSNVKSVCGNTNASTNPLVIGTISAANTTVPQALVFLGGETCPSNPTLLLPTGTSLSAVIVNSGSYLVFNNIGKSVKTGDIAQLVMKPGSYITAAIPSQFTPNQYAQVMYALLVASGTCPDFGAVTPSVSGCPPVDAVTQKVGSYDCKLVSTTYAGSCTISLSVSGPFSAQANAYIRVLMRKDCPTTSQSQVRLIIADVLGIPGLSLLFTYWSCGSITAYLTVLGGTAAQASAVLGQIYLSMLSGPLNSILSVISVSIVTVASPAANYTYATVNYAYYYPYVLPYLVPYSSSNPGLLALLTLLLIPVAIGLGLLFWCACRRRRVCPPPPPPKPVPICVPVPVPVCCPPPAPVCCCEPVCCPPPCYDPPVCCPPPCYDPPCCEPLCCPPPCCEPVCCPSPPPPCPPPQPCFQTVETVTVTNPEVVSY